MHPFRIGYPEVDRMGFFHHSRYFIQMECARTEFLRTLGDSYKAWEDSGYFIPLTGTRVEFKAPGRYDELIDVLTWMVVSTRIRLTFAYEFRRPADGATLAFGRTEHAFMGPDGRPRRLSPERHGMLLPCLCPEVPGHFPEGLR